MAQDNQDQQHRRGWLSRISLMLLTLVVMFVLAELFLQVFMPVTFASRHYWIPDGHVKARLEPNRTVTNMHGNDVHINHLGFRGEDWSWKPAAGTLRVVALGGSSTFCYQVTDDSQPWPTQLQKILGEQLQMPVEVLNLGLSGYDTSNSKVNYLFSGRALHPHVVLVYHTWNDLKFLRPIDKHEGTPWSVLKGRVSGNNPSWLTRLLRQLQVVQRIEALRTRFKERARENHYTSLEQEGEHAHAPVSPKAWSWFAQNFADVAEFVRDDGRRPVLISQASLVHESTLDCKRCREVTSNNYLGMTLPRTLASWHEASGIIERVAREHDALFVDGYNAVPHDFDHFKDHVHLWDQGALRLAQAVADALVADEEFNTIVELVRDQSPR